jgi:hypothetical protein
VTDMLTRPLGQRAYAVGITLVLTIEYLLRFALFGWPDDLRHLTVSLLWLPIHHSGTLLMITLTE